MRKKVQAFTLHLQAAWRISQWRSLAAGQLMDCFLVKQLGDKLARRPVCKLATRLICRNSFCFIVTLLRRTYAGSGSVTPL